MKMLPLLLILMSCGKKVQGSNTFPATCSFTPAFGTCQIINNSPKAVRCNFNSRARTLHNFIIWAHQDVYLYQGMYAWNYARAFNPWGDPIVEMSGEATCD